MPHSKKLPEFENLKNVHIIGVCGTLMGAFAAFLKRRGIAVTGSDQNVYPPMSDVLQKAGVQLFSGYSEKNLENLSTKPDLVVVGNVITAANPEVKAVIEKQWAYTSLPEAMETLLLKNTRNLVVAGTHGKTTTSSLLAFVLTHAGEDPNYFIGGVSHDLPNSFQVPSTQKNHPFVLEGDEYDTAFWDKVPKFNHYLPDDVILTSIEFDHADIYKNIDAVKGAFIGLVSRIRKNGSLIACADYPLVSELAKNAKVSVDYYASKSQKGVRYSPLHIHQKGIYTCFEVMDGDQKVADLELQIPGLHNVLNALSVWILCKNRGMDSKVIFDGLRKFKGVKRRQEERGEINGVLVIDDFAHHPTAVRETLRALRSKYPKRRLVSIFEPRSATSRRKVFQKDYVEAFLESDHAFIAVPYDQSKIPSDDQFSSEQLVSDIQREGKTASLFYSVDEGVKIVAQNSQSNDLIAVLSNGGFGGFIPKLLESLKNQN